MTLNLSATPQTVPNVSTDLYYIFAPSGGNVTIFEDGTQVNQTSDGENSPQQNFSSPNVTVTGTGQVQIWGFKREEDLPQGPGVGTPGGGTVDQTARDAAAAAQSSANNANATASAANNNVQAAINVGGGDVIEDTGFAYVVINLFAQRNFYIGSAELADALDNDIDLQTTGDGRFSIIIEKGATDTMDFTHSGWTFVGGRPDLSQPNTVFLIEGYIHSGFQVVAHVTEQNPNNAPRLRWQSFTTGLSQVTPFTTQNIDIPIATEQAITDLTLPAATTLPGITVNLAGDEFTLANAFTGELSYEAFFQIIGQDRTSVQIKIYADLDDGNGFQFVTGTKHDDYATRNQNEAPFATVDKIPLDVSFPAGTKLQARMATRQRSLTLKEFRLNLRT